MTKGQSHFDNLLVTNSQTARSLYALGNQTIATRVTGDPTAGNNGLFYIFSDHLGSTSVLAYGSGGQTGAEVPGSRARYYPFGSPRTTPTQTITDRNFTGQKENLELGLIYYNARYYVPTIGKFTSPDTLIPDPLNPQQFNRYTYTLNNPLTFTDPSGHCTESNHSGDEYEEDYACWQAYYEAIRKLGNGFEFLAQWATPTLQRLLFWLNQGVQFQNAGDGQWTSTDLTKAITSLNLVYEAVGGLSIVSKILGLNQPGGLKMVMCPNCDPNDQNHDYSSVNNTIRFDNSIPLTLTEILHELGHAVDWNIGNGQDWWSNQGLVGLGWEKNCLVFGLSCSLEHTSSYTNYANEGSYNFSPQEDFADTFVTFIYNQVEITPTYPLKPIDRSRLMALTTAFNQQ